MQLMLSKEILLRRLETGGGRLKDILPAAGIGGMLEFYADERADGCEIDADGDMLLYQWGTFDFGNGASFQLNITRQFIQSGDDEPLQLSLTFYYEPSAAVNAIPPANRWCHEPAGIRAFREFIEASPAFRAVAPVAAQRVTLDLSRC